MGIIDRLKGKKKTKFDLKEMAKTTPQAFIDSLSDDEVMQFGSTLMQLPPGKYIGFFEEVGWDMDETTKILGKKGEEIRKKRM